MNKKIGLISGMGAVAGAEAYKRINTIFQKKYNAENDWDYPDLLIHNIPSRGLSCKGIECDSILRNEILGSVKMMESVGVKSIGIACNSVHSLHKSIQESTPVEILNLVELSIKKILEIGVKKVGIIASNSTNKLNLYSQSFEENNITALKIPIYFEQESIDKSIENVIRGNHGYIDNKRVYLCAKQLIERGAEIILIGCTEISLITEELQRKSIPIVDSLDVLTENLSLHAKGEIIK